MLPVSVHSMAGKGLELQMTENTTVEHLKANIAVSWRVAPELQELMLGNDVLHDGEHLANRCGKDTEGLSLTMLVSLARVLCDLNDSQAKIRRAAVEALEELPATDDELLAVLQKMRKTDMDLNVRVAATDTLGALIDQSIILRKPQESSLQRRRTR